MQETHQATLSTLTAKPLFTDSYIAFSEFDREAMKRLIQQIDKPFKRILEIGSWLGNGSTRTIVEALRATDGVLYCVDHWQGNLNVQKHQDMVTQYDIFNTFKHNVASYGGSDIVKPLVMSSQEAAFVFKDQAFDLIFIDGTHSYEDTSLDIDLWISKVAPGGILCGHDCEGRAQDFGRDYLWANKHQDTVEGNVRFPRIHPGSILSVDEKFGDAVHLFAEETFHLSSGSGSSTIWDITIKAAGGEMSEPEHGLQSQSDLDAAHQKNERLKSRLQNVRAQLDKTRVQLHDAESTIAAMQTSKFWKLRTAWFNLKGSLKR